MESERDTNARGAGRGGVKFYYIPGESYCNPFFSSILDKSVAMPTFSII